MTSAMLFTALLCWQAAALGQPAEPPGAADLDFEQLSKTRVTSVLRQDSTVQKSPAAVFVISSEMIQRSGATTIPELLRMVPGVNVARIDNNKWAVSARGFNERFGGKLLVQIDGRTIYNPIFAGVYWDTVDYPLEDIERIEVIRGPGASVWGANAVNGVINIVTRRAEETQGGALALGIGTNERAFGQFRYGGRAGQSVAWRAWVKAFDRDEQVAAEGSSHDSWRGASGGFRVGWRATPKDQVTFAGGRSSIRAERRDLRPQPSAPYFVTNIEEDVTLAAHLRARWHHTTGDRSSWTLEMYSDRARRRSENGYIDFRWDTDDIDFQHQLAPAGRHQLVYGFGHRRVGSETLESAPDAGFAIRFAHPSRDRHLFSSFVQDQIGLIEDRLSLVIGSKLERNDVTGFELQPTVRMLWTASPGQTVWAGVSRAVRTPNMLEDDSYIKTLTSPGSSTLQELRGNPDLQAEQLLAFDLGYRVEATETLLLDFATFYNNYDDLIGAVRGPPEAFGSAVVIPANRANTLRGETYGLEAYAAWQVTGAWRMTAAGTVLRMYLHRVRPLPAAAEAAEGQSPRHQLAIQSLWDAPGNFHVDVSARFVDRLSGFNPGGAIGVPNGIDAYSALNLRVGWSPRPQLEVSLAGENLIHDRHAEFGTSPFTRSPLVELQRSVYARVTWRF